MWLTHDMPKNTPKPAKTSQNGVLLILIDDSTLKTLHSLSSVPVAVAHGIPSARPVRRVPQVRHQARRCGGDIGDRHAGADLVDGAPAEAFEACGARPGLTSGLTGSKHLSVSLASCPARPKGEASLDQL
jgi:hypothetical protein